ARSRGLRPRAAEHRFLAPKRWMPGGRGYTVRCRGKDCVATRFRRPDVRACSDRLRRRHGTGDAPARARLEKLMQNRWSMVLLCAALCGGCSGDEESPPAAATASAPATTPVAGAAQTSKAG